MNSSDASSNYISLGIIRGILGFPFEHPFEVTKLKNQAHPKASTWSILTSIFKQRGFKGFYDGTLSNLPRRVIKEAYRWPAIAYFHQFWNRSCSDRLRQNGFLPNIATAGCMAILEAGFILPFERILLARLNEGGYRVFFVRLKGEGGALLYQGITIAFLRHITAWATLMITNLWIKREIKRIDPKHKHYLMGTLAANVIIAANLTLFCLPLDFIKVNIQMHKVYQSQRLSVLIRELSYKYSWRGFYAGAIYVFLQKNVQALMGGAILDKMTGLR